ncbi:MAG: hypothetical protein RLZZ444_1286 [Pseudomonadota bacterium]|jgi:RND family efflux transporter MFP subunit
MMRNAALAILLATTFIRPAFAEDAEPKPEPVRPVLSMIVAPKANATDSFAGVIEPRFSAGLAFRVLGRITARNVDIGDVIQRGATIATLDPTALALAVQAARADAAAADAQMANATASEERMRQLLAGNTISQATYDSVQQGLETAKANSERAHAELAKAEEQLGYARLYSDFDGIVVAVAAEVGQTVSPGQTVVTVAKTDQREAVLDVPDTLVADLAIGTEFDVTLQSLPSLKIHGVLREVAPQSEGTTRTRRVRLTLENPTEAFRIGSTITAWRVITRPPTIELPASAVLESEKGAQVWIVDPGSRTVQAQPVTVVAKAGDIVTVDGLKPGTRVVTAGVHSLAEGQKIRFLKGAAQ